MTTDPEQNPFSPPNPVVENAILSARELRERHFALECSLRSISIVFFLGGLVLFVLGVGVALQTVRWLVAPFEGSSPLDLANLEAWALLVVSSLAVLVSIWWIWIAERLLRLDPRARIPAAIFLVIGLFVLPTGPIASLYLLSILLKRNAKLLFSDRYAQAVHVTPQYKYRQTTMGWVAACGSLLAYLFGCVAVINGLAMCWHLYRLYLA